MLEQQQMEQCSQWVALSEFPLVRKHQKAKENLVNRNTGNAT